MRHELRVSGDRIEELQRRAPAAVVPGTDGDVAVYFTRQVGRSHIDVTVIVPARAYGSRSLDEYLSKGGVTGWCVEVDDGVMRMVSPVTRETWAVYPGKER